MPTLTHFRLCPHSRSIRLLLGELGLPFTAAEERPWEYRTELMAMNPAGELPVLTMPGGPVLCGSYAISEYIADEIGLRPADGRAAPLFPGTREDRAEVRRLVDWFHGKFDREVSRELLYEKIYQRMRSTGPVPPDAEMLRAVRANLRYHLSYVSYLADHRRWLAGDEMSFADLAAAAQISTVDYLGEMLWDDFPPAKAWYQRIKSRPSFRPLLADRIPGTAPPLAYTDLDF